MSGRGRRRFREKWADYEQNPNDWELIATHTEKVSRKGARQHGNSLQRIYENKNTGELIVRHTVIDDGGYVVDDHWRPNYKPREGDLDDNLEESDRNRS